MTIMPPSSVKHIWEPHPGSQVSFLKCPTDEALLHGNRGGGKTDTLLMDFLQDVGVGFGAEWRGILFREEFTQLTDVINKSKKWIAQIFPGAKWNGSDHKWTFPEGEVLYLRYMRVPGDYWGYHGHEYPWIGWEELTNWATDECYKMMMSCNRSSNKYVPRKVRATCNPSGVGHGWVKHRFIDVIGPNKSYHDPETGKTRAHIVSRLAENTTLLEAQPDYQQTIAMAAQDDPVKQKAWVEGSWDIITGGFFTDLWDTKIHVIPSFKIPRTWSIHRSFDWGSTKPWCVSYVAECNGEQPEIIQGDLPYLPKGTCICIMEIYGWTGVPNTGDQATSAVIAERVLAVDKALEMEHGVKVHIGPADVQIWEVKDGVSIAGNMSKHGLWWSRGIKGTGSRVASLSIVRTMLGAAKRRDMENPHLYFFDTARHHIRTIPIQQHDDKKPEDIDTTLEDHCFVGDTLVITDKGSIPIIELVGTTGRVLSANGIYEKYCSCRLVKKQEDIVAVHFSDGTIIKCTPYHKFVTTSGLIQAKDLLTLSGTSCIVSISNKEGSIWKKLQLYQKVSRDFWEKLTIFAGSTFKEMVVGYTELFGNITMGQSQMGGMSIIKIKTPKIMNIAISNFFGEQSIYPITRKNGECVQLNNVGMRQVNGIKERKEGRGMKNIMPMLKIPFTQKLLAHAFGVVRKFSLIEKLPMLFAPQLVKPHTEGHLELTILQKSVSCVVPHTRATDMPTEKRVVLHAARHYVINPIKIEKLPYKEDVYCLEVPKTHLFSIENGVLVSNCIDSLRYMLARKLNKMKRRKVKS